MFKQTPSQTVGPFFHHGMLRGDENVLASDQTSGQRIRIVGTIYDGSGQPIPDAVLEIWQADARGFFNHPADPNCAQADPHFRGFGRTETVKAGQFEFKTIKPGRVPGRNGALQAPCVDVRIFARGMLVHVYTRLYFSDEASNETDPVLQSIDPSRRETLIAVREDRGDLPTYRFDIHIQGENETVFFEP